MPQRLKSFLIVRNDRLGDALLALPAIAALRSAHPDARISFLASHSIAPLISCVAGVDAVFEASDRDSGKLAPQLRQARIAAAFCLRATFTNARLLVRAGIPCRVGTSRRWYSFLFTDRVPLRRRGSDLHEADLNLALLGALGIPPADFFLRFNLPSNALGRGSTILTEAGVGASQSFVILHPGTGGSAREWPTSHFRALAQHLSAKGFRIVVTGSQSEAEKCDEVAGAQFINLCGKTDIVLLAAVIARSALLAAGSTGPLHLAVALGRPVVGLYPPVADCLPHRWGPYGHPEWALVPEVGLCSRCRSGEISDCRCMEQLSPEIVVAKALEVLGKNSNNG